VSGKTKSINGGSTLPSCVSLNRFQTLSALLIELSAELNSRKKVKNNEY